MPIIILRLEDILTSPKNPIDLASLPTKEASAHIKQVYGFFPKQPTSRLRKVWSPLLYPPQVLNRQGKLFRITSESCAWLSGAAISQQSNCSRKS